jgi:CRISPR/Cas system CSM-associated protein Csm4 (group 5 of RAMP superfamily)
VQHYLDDALILEFEYGTEKWYEDVKKSKYIDDKRYGSFVEGYLLLQDHGNQVYFKNMKIKELK